MPARTHLNNMLHAAFSDIFSTPQGATRKVYPLGYSDEVATKQSEKIAKTLRDTANFVRSLCRLVLGVSIDTLSSSLLAPDEIGSYRGRRYY